MLHQLEKLGEKIAKDSPFVISQFLSKVNPTVALLLCETLDKTVEAARRVELSFQTPPTASNTNQSLDEWKVTPPNAFVSSTALKPQDQHSVDYKELVTILDKQIICRGIVQNAARTLQSKLRSATITIDFLAPIQ